MNHPKDAPQQSPSNKTNNHGNQNIKPPKLCEPIGFRNNGNKKEHPNGGEYADKERQPTHSSHEIHSDVMLSPSLFSVIAKLGRPCLTSSDITGILKTVKSTRIVVTFPKDQMAKLKAYSDVSGIPMAEVIRRGVKEYLKKRK